MDKISLKTLIFDIASQILDQPADSLDGAAPLASLGFDGMDLTELILELEDQCEIMISPEEQAQIQRLNDILPLVTPKISPDGDN